MQPATTFTFYRTIGNDLPPRHRTGQSLDNVRFILENEPNFPGCTKRWMVNRIVHRADEDAVLAMLEDYEQPYLRIPFDLDEYAEQDWDLDCFPDPTLFYSAEFDGCHAPDRRWAEHRARRRKVVYAMNVNGARNLALREGRRTARWVLPWDGNCFLTEGAWKAITRSIEEHPSAKYIVVPMARLCSNDELSSPTVAAHATEEPQVMFRADAVEEFDERYPYGWRNKTDLLTRIGVAGIWDTWSTSPWDLPANPPSVEAGQFITAGWVARLDSGNPGQERGPKSLLHRGIARTAAILSMIDELDSSVLSARVDPGEPVYYQPERLDWLRREVVGNARELTADLKSHAQQAIGRGTQSVTRKATVAPSGDIHDYTSDDRTGLQRLFDDSTLCALAWETTKDQCYADHAAALIRCWFVDPQTRMNPHLRYARVRPDQASQHGISDAKDLYYFLDAARTLERSGTLGADDVAALRRWLTEYRDWLVTSDHGVDERRKRNSHGTFYDLQLGAVAAYLGDAASLVGVLRRFRERLRLQFAVDGSQPLEQVGPHLGHHTCLSLQGWIGLAGLARWCGADLWHYETADGRGMRRALLAGLNPAAPWMNGDLDAHRLAPIRMAYEEHFGEGNTSREVVAARYVSNPAVLDSSYGIRPYWFL
ncbi:alginate lyase family protein [Nocardia sp. CA-128927]|uniref:alginate lyase family protein n=1 Tax=Nocardia sp. CA-128927 TaxID=3239975 RepID=UPI003D967CE3